ncbi:uncharacterized protein METZ01_LOCUS503330, partial [marine metagenome]
MNLKNINNYFILSLLFFLFSCLNNNISIDKPIQIDEIEDKDIISNIYFGFQGDFRDYYYRNANFKWNISTNLNKNFIINTGKNLSSEFNVSNFIIDKGYIYFIKLSGPSQICYKNQEISSQGVNYHTEGYSTPLGKLKKYNKAIHQLNTKQKNELQLAKNNFVNLYFKNGIHLKGKIKKIIKK